MFKFIGTYRLYISIVATFIVLFFLMYQTYNEQGTSRFQMAVQTITYPVQTSVQSVVSTIKNTWNSYLNLIEVNEENKMLKQQLLNMEEKLNQHIENSVQFFRLRSQLLFAQKKSPQGNIFRNYWRVSRQQSSNSLDKPWQQPIASAQLHCYPQRGVGRPYSVCFTLSVFSTTDY